MFERKLTARRIRRLMGDLIYIKSASKTRKIRRVGPLDQTSLFCGIPKPMEVEKNFLLYALFEPKVPGGKKQKIPVDPESGLPLKDWSNRKNLMPYELAYSLLMQHPDRFAGLGYAMTGNGLICVDIDKARNETGGLTPLAQSLVKTIPGWVEISTSGNLHIWTRGQWPESKSANHELGVEVFNSSGFIALTGNALDAKRAIPDSEVDLKTILAPYFDIRAKEIAQTGALDPFELYSKRDPNLTIAEARRVVLEELKPTPKREDWLRVGMALHFQFEGDPEALAIWDEFSAREECGNYLGFEDVRDQWESFDLNHHNPVTFASLREALKKQITRESALTENPFVVLNLEGHKAIDYLLKGIIDQGIALFHGASNAGKTTLMVDLVCIVAHLCPEDHFLRVKGRRKVIYLTEDVGQIERIFRGKRSFGGLSASPEEINTWVKIISGKKFDGYELIHLVQALADQEAVTSITKRGDRHLPPLFVIDTASANFKIEDENKNSEVSSYIAALKAAISASGASVWVIAHTPKASRSQDVTETTARGAGAWGDNVQTVVGIQREVSGNLTTLAVLKNRIATSFNELEFVTQMHSVAVEDDYGDEQTLSYVIGNLMPSTTAVRLERKERAKQERADSQKRAQKSELADKIMAHVRDYPYQNNETIRDAFGGSNTLRERAIRELLDEGYLIRVATTPEEKGACGKRILLKRTDKPYPMFGLEV